MILPHWLLLCVLASISVMLVGCMGESPALSAAIPLVCHSQETCIQPWQESQPRVIIQINKSKQT